MSSNLAIFIAASHIAESALSNLFHFGLIAEEMWMHIFKNRGYRLAGPMGGVNNFLQQTEDPLISAKINLPNLKKISSVLLWH